ncbi:MAG: polysaccharide deacetylase family protein [Chitinophagaceae bacterium]|nr:polysaccharide deacetylase family protein [Chitinophagaceae bacterium]
MNRYVLLSFDVEEFDMPLEYGFPITAEEQMELGKKGLDAIGSVLDDEAVQTTLFTTANFAQHFPSDIRRLAERHEIASHTFYHSSFRTEHLLQSREKLEEISGKKITGLRMPRMKKVAMTDVIQAGYGYDSSINPTWLPGRYNNLHLPRTVYMDQGMKRMPASVSPGLRIPLFWLSFKNLPYPVFRWLAMQTLKKDGYLCLYFHPWEFIDISKYGLPAYTRRPDGEVLLTRLRRLIADLKPHAQFTPIRNFLSTPDRRLQTPN